jgi:hypothetical protein
VLSADTFVNTRFFFLISRQQTCQFLSVLKLIKTSLYPNITSVYKQDIS